MRGQGKAQVGALPTACARCLQRVLQLVHAGAQTCSIPVGGQRACRAWLGIAGG